MSSDLKILVVYYSAKGATEALARAIARGIEMKPGCEAVLRTAPPVAAQSGEAMPSVPESGAPYVAKNDIRDCGGLALGSPTRFGAPSAPIQHFPGRAGRRMALRHAGQQARRGVRIL